MTDSDPLIDDAHAPRLQLLLVEDDALLREHLDARLTAANFDVFAVGTAREAREVMAAIVCPIVVIDRILEDGDGLGLISELRRTYIAHRVFLALFTALDSLEERRAGMEAGADAYIAKQGQERTLLDVLRKARALVHMKMR